MKSTKEPSSAGWLKKAIIGTAAVAAVAVGSISTYAAFQDTTTSNISVTAGTIDLRVGGAKTFPIDLGTTMKPGDSVSKTIVVNNAGTIPLDYTGTTVGATSGPLAGSLLVTVKDGLTTLGTANQKLNALNIPKQTLAKGGTQTLTVTVDWPNGTPAVDNPLEGLSGNTILTFTGTSQAGTVTPAS